MITIKAFDEDSRAHRAHSEKTVQRMIKREIITFPALYHHIFKTEFFVCVCHEKIFLSNKIKFTVFYSNLKNKKIFFFIPPNLDTNVQWYICIKPSAPYPSLTFTNIIIWSGFILFCIYLKLFLIHDFLHLLRLKIEEKK